MTIVQAIKALFEKEEKSQPPEVSEFYAELREFKVELKEGKNGFAVLDEIRAKKND